MNAHTLLATRDREIANQVARLTAMTAMRAVQVVQNGQKNWYELELQVKSPPPAEITRLRTLAAAIKAVVQTRRTAYLADCSALQTDLETREAQATARRAQQADALQRAFKQHPGPVLRQPATRPASHYLPKRGYR